jgi:aminoglycoside phosphotransferase (APT) family kinase protein
MSDSSPTTTEATIAPRPGMELDMARLEAYLTANIEGYAGPLTVRQFKGGQSNPTYLLSTPQRSYVLRKKPPGHVLASAHAVDREFRVMSALAAHSDVPVPRMHALCLDTSVLGTELYVMEHVNGRIFRDARFANVPRTERSRYSFAACDALARLHRLDPTAAGLQDYGKPAGYVARQISRWSKQYHSDTEAGRVEAMDRLIEWFPAHLPAEEERAAILHGDYRVDNVIFHPHEPRVLAILDWELSSLGEARADIAYHLMPFRMPTLLHTGLLGTDFRALGLPTEEEYIAHYCAAVGRETIADLEFYLAFCMFRLAGIFHGIRGRLLRGNAVSERAREFSQHVEAIAELAWKQAQRAG